MEGIIIPGTSQTKISTSLSQTTNVQVPSPLPQPLQVPVPLSQLQTHAPSQHMSSHETTLGPETTLNSIDLHSLKRKGRGRTRGKGTDDIKIGTGYVNIGLLQSFREQLLKGEIDLNYETHYSVNKWWVNYEAQTRYKRMFEIKEQPIPEGSQAPTRFEIMQEVLVKCRGYIRGLGHGPKPVASRSVDLTSPNTESIVLREQIEK
ncbi:Uncharacterized protein Adt_35394 [Abeliophyllum distichum]|uniref:Uncharacterized protein n=1 Tax=Abeliophyllum distichum TaxID=126358 RepID=A0ABD1QES1_9LAMI